MTQLELISILDLIQQLTHIKVDWYEYNEFDHGKGNHVWNEELKHLTLNVSKILNDECTLDSSS